MKKITIFQKILHTKRHFAFFFIFAFFHFSLLAQKDSTQNNISNFLAKGELGILFKSYTMATINHADNQNYFALAKNIRPYYISPSWHGFSFKASGNISYGITEYNLLDENENWTKTGHEKFLFDINNPTRRYSLGSLEDAYLRYQIKGFHAKLGRQMYGTPFLNPYLDRLKPNVFQGISMGYGVKQLKLSGAWFISENIRGTLKDYSIRNSIGVYSQGINALTGEKGNYRGQLSTYGIGVLGAEYDWKNWKNQLWNFYADNIFNLTFFQSDYTLKREKANVLFGLQGLFETAVKSRDKLEDEHLYILPNEKAFAVGGRIGIEWRNKLFNRLSFNLLNISKNGRYLFPKEWGKEMFYAEQSRGAFEGNGDLKAYVLKYGFTTENLKFRLDLGAGFIDLPERFNHKLNKYQAEDYYHFSLNAKYWFENKLDGLMLDFLAVYKKGKDVNYPTLHYIGATKPKIEDLMNFSLIITYPIKW